MKAVESGRMFHKLAVIGLEIKLFALFAEDKVRPELHVTDTWRDERWQENLLRHFHNTGSISVIII